MVNQVNGNGQFITQDPFEYLMSKIEVDTETECWNWVGHCFPAGYGYFKNKAIRDGKPTPASRASWILHKGSVPPRNMFVCHRCDNRRCVNPAHLFLGSGKDNMQDCSEKRRIDHGENRPQSKLTEESVRGIRRLRQQGYGWLRLAKMYGVAENAVISAAKGITWSHVDEPIPTFVGRSGKHTSGYKSPGAAKGSMEGFKNPAAKLTSEHVQELRAWWDTGEPTLDDLAKHYGITATQVHRIAHRKSWKNVPDGDKPPTDAISSRQRLRHDKT